MTAALSPRECEVLLEVCLNGGTNKELGRRLGMAPATARTHVQNVLQKCGVHSKAELVVTFYQHLRGVRPSAAG